MNNNEKRGKFIAELRNEKGYTQQELGNLLNYTDKAISRWERGEATVNLDVISDLSNIFDVSIAELIYGERKIEENEQEIQDNIEEELTNNYHKFRKGTTKMIITFMSVIILGLILIYMIFIRNSISVYSIMGESDNISEKNGTLILSNKLSIMNFNQLTIKSDKVIENIQIYYIDKSKNKIYLFSGTNDNYYIEEKNGYEEYHLKAIPKRELILEIDYTDGSAETLNLQLQRKFVNDSIFPKKVDTINDETKTSSKSNDNLEERLYSLGFEKEEDEFVYIVNDNTNCYINLDINRIRILIQQSKSREELISYISANEIKYEKRDEDNNLVLGNLYNDSDNKKNCNNEVCSTNDDYIMYIAYLKEQIK